MSGHVAWIKGFAAAGAVVAAHTAADDVALQREVLILGIHQAVLMTAVTGALIAVLLIPDTVAAPVGAPGATTLLRRCTAAAVRTATLGGFVFSYALVAGWGIEAASAYMASITQAAVPLAGIAGLFARKLLPTVIRGIERKTSVLAGDGGAKS